ncbi:MAG: hypothetical protein JW747_01815 [Candidatus Aminicenantes bacterium]|nr:hypothetical protein [Candidatus Aminicenantes bacterium]
MALFFVKDSRHHYRCFEADSSGSPSVRFSRAREAWEKAKEKLMLLPQRVLRREQAFANASKLGREETVTVFCSGLEDEKHIGRKFRLFLHKQRTSHLLALIAESLVLPLAGLSGLLPGPNVAFYSLVLLMILQWRAQRGIRRILHLPREFRPQTLLEEWEAAVEEGRREDFPLLLERIERELGVVKARKILERPPDRRRD